MCLGKADPLPAFKAFGCKAATPTACFTQGGMCGCWPQVANNDLALHLKPEVVDVVYWDATVAGHEVYEGDAVTTLANVIRATSAPTGTANASQSGNRLAGLMRKSLTALGASIGGTAMPHVKPAVGAAVGAIAGRGAETLGGAKNAAEARQLFAGQVPVTIGERLRQAGRPVVVTGQRRFAPITRQYLQDQQATSGQ